MFENRYSYHGAVRKAVISFGTLFNSISIRRKDNTGTTIQNISVPLSYGPKQKFIQSIQFAPTLDTGRAEFEIILPFLGFEITGIQYDPSRKLPLTQKISSVQSTGSIVAGYVATPYNLNISLTSWTKNQDDAYQIIEQILPYFNPDFTVPIIAVPELGIKHDLQIVLNDITFTDDYTGNSDQRVALMWEFHFTVKMMIYGYVSTASVIKTIISNIYTQSIAGEGDKITITPDPVDATADSNYGFLTEFDTISSV